LNDPRKKSWGRRWRRKTVKKYSGGESRSRERSSQKSGTANEPRSTACGGKKQKSSRGQQKIQTPQKNNRGGKRVSTPRKMKNRVYRKKRCAGRNAPAGKKDNGPRGQPIKERDTLR